MWGQRNLRCSLIWLRMSSKKITWKITWRFLFPEDFGVMRFIPKIKGTNTMQAPRGTGTAAGLTFPAATSSQLLPTMRFSSISWQHPAGGHSWSVSTAGVWAQLVKPPCHDLGQPGQHLPSPERFLVLSDPGHSGILWTLPFSRAWAPGSQTVLHLMP